MSDSRDKVIVILIVLIGLLMVIHYVNKMYVFAKGKKRRHRPHPPYCPPLAKGFILKEVKVFENNNLITTFKGNIMSVTLVGKQQVQGTLAPIDRDGNVIDLTKWSLDQIILPGSSLVSSGDLNLFSVAIGPDDPLTVTVVSVGDVAGTANLTYLARNINNESISIEEPVTVTVPETTTTSSTSTSSTTTEAPETAPVATGFQLNWGTPIDIVS